MDTEGRVSRLVEWAAAHGACLHPSVEVYPDSTTGFSFRVKQASASSSFPSLAAWDRVVSLPTSLTLSYLNAVHHDGRRHPFQGAFMDKTPPHVVGRFFLAWQYLLGEESFWSPYIQALPQPDEEEEWQLAPFWPADDVELLEGTNVEVGLEKIMRDVRNEYSRAAELFSSSRGDDSDQRLQGMTMKLYQWAYCIFSSRSFRPSLVIPQEEGQRAHLPPGVGMDDFSVLLPLFDIGNHDMTVDVKWDVVPAATSEQPQSPACELRVGRAFQPGQQVFNNYSMKTNAELLLGYGFMIPPTQDLHNDYIHVRKRAGSAPAAVAAAAAAASSSEEYYISLRPMKHSSSLLGRHKQSFAVEGGNILGAFAHLQTDMVWDIFTTVVTGSGGDLEEVLPLLPGEEGQGARRQRFFTGDVSDACMAYVEQTAAVIQHKVLQELERLDETDVEVEEGDRQSLTKNQRLALEYRRRCREVLESTLEAMETM